ncbi:MAG: hypothetical protein DI546_07905 [Rhizobium sp.]|nr:MAG: hypothetical protein DI546_07905 [Rhizobium sp.]
MVCGSSRIGRFIPRSKPLEVPSGILNVAAGKLAWDRHGTGPALVLVHGFSFDRSMWDAQVAALSQAFTVARYDLRGFGQSSRPSGPYDHVEDLATFIASQAFDRPILVGLSLGANVILEYAGRHSAAVRGMVLASAGLPGHVWTTKRPPEAIKALAQRAGLQAARQAWLDHPIYATARARPGAGAALTAMIGAYDGWHWTNDDPRIPAGDITGMLGSIAVPALVLSGGHDDPGYRDIAQRLATELPDARLVTFKEGGHLLNVEEPSRFNGEVEAFAAALV